MNMSIHPSGTKSCKISSSTRFMTTVKTYQKMIDEYSKEGLELATNPSVDVSVDGGIIKAGKKTILSLQGSL